MTDTPTDPTPPPAMEQPVPTHAPLDQVRGLVAERARYEGWLSALDGRRDAAPSHVLDRVRQDYQARLRRVLDGIEAHAPALRADEAALARRHDEQQHALAERRDELAEVELRTLVGEYAPDEGAERRQSVEGAIRELEETVSGAAAQLADVRGLLAHVQPAPEPAAPEPAPAGIAEPVESVANAPASDPAAAPPVAAAPPPPSPAEPFADPFGGPRAPAPSFTGQGFAEAATAAAAFGTPVGVGAVAQEKTLRCAECGAMNYPTEWYCEKCGGELAAL